MRRNLSVEETVSFLLEISKEADGWAKHYDGARYQLLMLLVGASGGGTIFILTNAPSDKQIFGLVLISVVCLTLTTFIGLYTRLYKENFRIHKNLRRYASLILLERISPNSLSRLKIDKKIYEARFSALEFDLPNSTIFNRYTSGDLLASESEYVEKLEEMYSDFWGFILERNVIISVKSLWIWICLGSSLVVPALAVQFVSQPCDKLEMTISSPFFNLVMCVS